MKIQWKIKHFKEKKKRLCDPLCNHLYPTTHLLSALHYHSGTLKELRLFGPGVLKIVQEVEPSLKQEVCNLNRQQK